MSPSSRLEARNQTRAIPLVAVSLARGQLRQTRLASISNSSIETSQSAVEQDLDQNNSRHHNAYYHPGDLPPSYDSVTSRAQDAGVEESLHESRLASPSNADLTEAVLHLSRTLVSSPRPQPSPSSSWLFMMIYNWTHTQKTATRLYHILTKPGTLLQHIRGQNDQIHQQQKKQRKSLQQISDEQDRMEDDPDMLSGTVTEMIPVSMMNTRTVASMADDYPSTQTQDSSELSNLRDDVTEDSTTPRKPKRRIESYPNPFAPTNDDMEPQEDDEGWFGRGDDCSEDGITKTNSVRLTSPTIPHSLRGQIPEFTTSSLGPAMDPRQLDIEADYGSHRSNEIPIPSFPTSSIFNRSTGVTFDRPSSRASFGSQSTISNYVTPPSSMVSPAPSANSYRTLFSTQHSQLDKALLSLWQQDTTIVPRDDEHLVSAASSIYYDLPSDGDDSPWIDQSSSLHEHHRESAVQFPVVVRSSTASVTDAPSIVISTSSPDLISAIPISSATSVRSFEAAIS
ncbi:hypothetical protein FBU30_001538 [Linnemannia zychae]|nr:hypothetical protein FBU30_001538 [Linnemannia zychae]